MFKFLKSYQNRENVCVLALFLTLFFYFDYFDNSEQLEQLDKEIALLTEETSKKLDSMIEMNKLLLKNLESDNENFVQFEQRIASLQELLNNAGLNSSDLTDVRSEIADISQFLKRANETRRAVLSE